MATQYVLLMRHVAAYRPHHSGVGEEERSTEQPALLAVGVRAARSVADRLAETLRELPPDRRARIGETWYAPGPEPTATATVLAAHADVGRPLLEPRMEPAQFFPGGGPPAAAALAVLAADVEERVPTATANALLLVGHEPQMGWLANRLTGRPVPLDRGELVCLARPVGRGRWRLCWTIHPDDSAAVTVIREKIKSKMDAAKVMGAFITALVTFVLGQFLAHPDAGTGAWVLRVVTVALLLAAAGLFFVSLFFYDSLLMPARFWSARAPRAGDRPAPTWLVARPPSSAAWVLYQNMVRIWNRTFVPAVWLVGVALAAFCQAVLEPARLEDYWVLPAVLVGAVLVGAWSRLNRPRFGAQD